jgi:hypothetical protein
MSVLEHYAVVLKDLIDKRDTARQQLDELSRVRDVIVSEIERLNTLVAGMEKYISLHPADPAPSVAKVPAGRYSHMSMRWACLKFLTEDNPNVVLTTANIAANLLSGGYPPSPNLNSKLSAILGQMVTKGEIDKHEEGWLITSHGRDRWEGIKISEKYVRRHELFADRGISEEVGE